MLPPHCNLQILPTVQTTRKSLYHVSISMHYMLPMNILTVSVIVDHMIVYTLGTIHKHL